MELQLKDIELAAKRLNPILHHTELDMSTTFSTMTGGNISQMRKPPENRLVQDSRRKQ